MIRLLVSLLLLHSIYAVNTCTEEAVKWVWQGAFTSSSVLFKIGLEEGHTCHQNSFVLRAYPELVEHEHPHSSITTCEFVNDEWARVVTCNVQNLPHANRKYQYELSLQPRLEDAADQATIILRQGTIDTPVVEGSPMDFRMAFASCADEYSDPDVFDEIASHHPLFFLHMGDIHYHDIIANSKKVFRDAYDSIFSSPSGSRMLAMDIPMPYMWDDHDFGPDNSDSTAPGANASLEVYRQVVPHYPLPSDLHPNLYDAHSAIYQSFTVGRVRVIMTDLRSQRTPNTSPDKPSKTVLGPKQKQWFKEELVQATEDENIQLILWCSTMPWLDDERKWGHFRHEQQELVSYMQAHALNKYVPIVIVSGDAHMLAVDDGSHSPGGLPVLHAAALGRPGSIKGGPYSHGALPGSGQYGILDIHDDGSKVCVVYKGKKLHQGTQIEYSTCHPERTPPTNTYYPPPIWVRQVLRVWKKFRRTYLAPTIVFVGAALLLLLGLRSRHTRTKKE